MGVVYLASRKSDSVALKVIRESLIDDEVEAARFTREVVTLEKIQSPNVAEIIEAGVDDGRAWFAVEFINGPNLSELVDDKGPLPLEKWWELAAGVLRGLADVHRMGIIHRDVKPANVIMAATGPKLIDFGIAHVSDATSVTATGLVAGSPAWFSPEQIEGLELTTATDVFSAGSLLIFAATGSSPWGGATTMTKASVFKILTSEPDLSGLSPAQVSLVSAMLDKEAGNRPAAAWLASKLDEFKAGQEPRIPKAPSVVEGSWVDAPTTSTKAFSPPERSSTVPLPTPPVELEEAPTLGTESAKRRRLSKKHRLVVTAGVAGALVFAGIAPFLFIASESAKRDSVEGYFEALATNYQGVNFEAFDFASPDSLAQKYIRIQENQGRAYATPFLPDLFQDTDRVELCELGDSPGDEGCTLFSDFEFEGAKLSNFSVENIPIAGRMALGDGTQAPIIDWGSVTLLSAFESTAGPLFITLAFSSPSDRWVPLDEVLYLPSNGDDSGNVSRAVLPDYWGGPNIIRAGEPTVVNYLFESQKLGGQLTLDFEGAETVVVNIPTQ